MHYHLVTIFPEIFDSFLATSLLAKAQGKGLIQFSFVNPRDFCSDPQKQVDDEIYGGGAGMLLKALPVIDALRSILSSIGIEKVEDKRTGMPHQHFFKIVMLTPSQTEFNQTIAHYLAEEVDHLILLCGRYEGFDHRIEERCLREFPGVFEKVSLGKYVTLGGEIPAMCVIEATARLLPGVIKEEASRQEESYSAKHQLKNLEYPQYTRPEVVEGLHVPEVLLSGNHAAIETWRKGNQELIEEDVDE